MRQWNVFRSNVDTLQTTLNELSQKGWHVLQVMQQHSKDEEGNIFELLIVSWAEG